MNHSGKRRPSLVGSPFSASEFREKRRQQFLTHEYFEINRQWLGECIQLNTETLKRDRAEGNITPFAQRRHFSHDRENLLLHYTAGASIDSLRPLFEEMLTWFKLWHAGYAELIQSLQEDDPSTPLRTDGTPLRIDEELEDFQTAISVISLAVLFGDFGAVQDVAYCLRQYRHEDTLIESLLEPAMSVPSTVDEFYFVDPYDPLLDAVFTKDGSGAQSSYMAKFLARWYKAFEGASWHDGHLVKKEHMMPYYGYWSFEAAAASVIYGIDDSSFRDCIVYPKDFADWARKNDSVGKLRAGAKTGEVAPGLRCLATQPCPRSGHWFTPARVGSRRRFVQGEMMPEVGGDYGVTIWQWDAQQ